jgi:hypothetical protein
MADVGTSSVNMTATASPSADQMGVDPSLEPLAVFIVQGQTAWTQHDGATLNNLLQGFWNAAQNWDGSTLQNQSYGTLVGSTIQADITALDGYSHRLLGFEYLWQMDQNAAPADIPGILALQVAQFQAAVADWNAVGLTMQASHDNLILQQAGAWAAQDASVWVDDSYTAAVKAQVNTLVEGAGNLISAAGGALAFLSNPMVLIGAAVILALLLLRRR